MEATEWDLPGRGNGKVASTDDEAAVEIPVEENGRYVSKAYASRHPERTLADRSGRRQRVSLLVAVVGVAVAAPAMTVAAYKRLAK
jgi:hypothetical protein